MISQEQFDKIELEHGCGYWNLCAEHACPCAITTENKGLQESIYNGLIEENRKLAEEYDNDNDDYEPLNIDDDIDYDDNDSCPCEECICRYCKNENKCTRCMGCDGEPLALCSDLIREI